MSVVTRQFHLSSEQKRFFELLAQYPTLTGYWDIGEKRCLEDELNEAMSVLSHGERVMAQFFHAVWSGSDSLGLGLMEAAATLDETNRAVIAAWLAEPFYP